MLDTPGFTRSALRAAGRMLDRAHGVETAAPVPGEALGHPHDEHRAYDPSRWLALPVALHGLPRRRGDVFADLGAGKGRVVIQAARRYPFARVLGVERSPELVAAARANLARQRPATRERIELVTADLTRWRPPPDLTLAYTYNSVQGNAFSETIERLLEAVAERGRSLTLVYVNPVEHERVMATGRARELPPPPRALVRLARLGTVGRYRLLPG